MVSRYKYAVGVVLVSCNNAYSNKHCYRLIGKQTDEPQYLELLKCGCQLTLFVRAPQLEEWLPVEVWQSECHMHAGIP